MYDPKLKKSFSVGDRDSHTFEWFGQNENIDPIWATNQKEGENRKSAAEWPGSNITFSNQSIVNIDYKADENYKDLVDKFIKLFTDEHDPVNFAALYFNEPDKTGHAYGPNSREMGAKLAFLDCVIGYLIAQLKSHHLFDKLNVIMTSDHGMADAKNNVNVYLDSYLDYNLINF